MANEGGERDKLGDRILHMCSFCRPAAVSRSMPRASIWLDHCRLSSKARRQFTRELIGTFENGVGDPIGDR